MVNDLKEIIQKKVKIIQISEAYQYTPWEEDHISS